MTALALRAGSLPAAQPTVTRQLRPYQDEAINWLLSTTSLTPHRFLVLDPGLGKTAVAIRAAYELGAQNVLVVCPAVAKIVWKTEIPKWWPAAELPEILVIQPGVGIRTPIPRPGWTIIAYSNLSITSDKWLARLANLDWDVVIIDECQYLKALSNRTHAVYGGRLDATSGSLAGAGERVWLLSGTPAPNNVSELYTHLKALFPTSLPHNVRNIYQFQDRYCNVQDTPFGRRITGSKVSAIPELRGRIAPHVLRRRRQDVLKDLPPIGFYDTPLDVACVDNFGLLPTDDDGLINTLQANEIALATARRFLGEAKIEAAAEFCEELLQQMPVAQRKLVVFAYHRSVIAGLERELKDWEPVVIDGSTSQRQREDALELFQQNPGRAQVFVGQILASGVAITLTAADTAVFVECSWVPSENLQAALRIHRLGQTRGCTVHFLHVPGSLDERIMRAFRRKAAELAQLFS
jgi:SWI/SNF-related matrix-associated actin-dependent regulator of chromatin subfamily A-like protein 1